MAYRDPQGLSGVYVHVKGITGEGIGRGGFKAGMGWF